ncbi:signal peptidase II [Nocardioides sp. GY 10113]|uniref:signal peptidase II n=1 Tax=Nocardioides sp. GY 10113 TaxID=2569761 RepID=UPI0010A8A63F|nr:signal peptidase II [Nocardioides sp. GY 10113]TIC88631.1 signal peptidase II [Nocardioides sp. GY 10113]
MQAARGTPVGEDSGRPDSEQAPEVARRGRRGPWLLFVLVAAAMYGADQLTKYLAVEHLDGAPDKPLIGELLQLRLTYNPGAAFSLGTDLTVAITCLAVVATVTVLVISLRLRDRVWAVALGLLLAGIAGNLTDRLLREPQAFHGHVVDFLMLPNWPIFNVADICINLGAALVLVQVFRGVGLDGSRATGDEALDARRDEDPKQ